MTAVEIGLDEIEEFGAGDDWAERIVEAMAFRHVAVSSSCRGYCMAGSGRTLCGMCGWSLSGRMEDACAPHGGLFALAVLATLGAAVAPLFWLRRYPMKDPLRVGELAALDDRGNAVFCSYAGRVVHRDHEGVVIDTRDV